MESPHRRVALSSVTLGAFLYLLFVSCAEAFLASRRRRLHGLNWAGSLALRARYNNCLGLSPRCNNMMSAHTTTISARDSNTVEHRDPENRERYTSLAASYLVEIESNSTAEIWSLIPIADVTEVTKDMAEGTRSLAALQSQSEDSSSSLVLECTRNGEENSVKVTLTTKRGSDEDDALVATLSRILVQRYVRQQVRDDGTEMKLCFPGEETMFVEDVLSDAGVLKLFSMLDTSNVELIEMVDRNGHALGMVPRPLVHSFNLLHRGIGMVVTKERPIVSKGTTELPDLYAHRRTDTKRIFPSLYDMFVGGVSSAHEDAKTTAAREVAEELGLSRADALSDPLFDCTVCTSYNRCVVTVFCYTSSPQETIAWQEEEVAWGDFVPYAVIEAAAYESIQRLRTKGTWPGTYPPSVLKPPDPSASASYDKDEWSKWDFVPDGLLVWEAWLRWQTDPPTPSETGVGAIS